MALLSVYRVLLKVYMALLRVYRALLRVNMALLSVPRALWSVSKARWSVYRALLSVSRALFWVCIGLFCVFTGLFWVCLGLFWVCIACMYVCVCVCIYVDMYGDQICSPEHDCWRMVHKTSCIVRCNGGSVKKDSLCWVQRAHTWYHECVAVCVAVQTAHKWCDDCFNRTSFCICVKGTKILATEAVFTKVTMIVSSFYGPAGLLFWYSHMSRPNSLKDFRDRSELLPWCQVSGVQMVEHQPHAHHTQPTNSQENALRKHALKVILKLVIIGKELSSRSPPHIPRLFRLLVLHAHEQSEREIEEGVMRANHKVKQPYSCNHPDYHSFCTKGLFLRFGPYPGRHGHWDSKTWRPVGLMRIGYRLWDSAAKGFRPTLRWLG